MSVNNLFQQQMPESALPQFNFEEAAQRLSHVVKRTPLTYNAGLSKRYKAEIYLKREDLQIVRSYKLRGAYNMMSSLPQDFLDKGVVCASAGNHAQGFAYSCKLLGVKGTVFMPVITPKQKVRQTEMFGDGHVTIRLFGDTFDDCSREVVRFSEATGQIIIPPFEHLKIIEGQGTVAVEILEDLPDVDYVFVPVGGGGLCAGTGTYLKSVSPLTKIIGVEPAGAPSMTEAFNEGGPVMLASIDSFVDGAAVKKVGSLTYEIARKVLDQMVTVPEGKVCTTILSLYNENAIVAEPAGALSVAALDTFAEEIKGRKVVCVLSGGNNDIDRMQEIKERSLLYEQLKHYFLINFAQRPGALKEFVNNVLGENDDIVRFEYMKKNNKDTGPALVGIELHDSDNFQPLIQRMKSAGFQYSELNKDKILFSHLI